MKDNERTCTKADMTIENEDDSFGLEGKYCVEFFCFF